MARRYKRRYVFTLVYLILSVIVFVVLNAIPGNFAQRPLPISGWLLVVVIFGGAFLFLLIWGIIQFFVQDYILENGDLVEGRVIEHDDVPGRGFSRNYYLTYRYEYRGEPHTKEQRVSKETYRQIPDGTRISVRCLPDNPKRARISDEAVTQGTKWPPKTT